MCRAAIQRSGAWYGDKIWFIIPIVGKGDGVDKLFFVPFGFL